MHGFKRIKSPVHHDARGFMRVIDDCGFTFLEHSISVMKRNVLKGIHGERTGSNWKVLTCVSGLMLHIAVDLSTRTYEKTWLTPDGPSVIIPPMVGSAVYVGSEMATLLYQQTQKYTGPERQFTIRYNDPAFNICWPLDGEPILSERDAKAKFLK